MYHISLFTGLKRQMLEPTRPSDDGTYRLNIPEYINVEDDLRCSTTATMKRFQNFQEYDEHTKSAINFAESKTNKTSTGILFWKSTVSLLSSKYRKVASTKVPILQVVVLFRMQL